MYYPFSTPKYHSISDSFYIVMAFLASEAVHQPHLSRQPVLGASVSRYYFYNRLFALSQPETLKFTTGGKNQINYFMQVLLVISWSPCGSCVSVTGRAICSLSGSSTYTSFVLGIKTGNKPFLILAQHIYKGTGAKE